jgi:predicted nucleic acid-binding protein
MASTPAAKSAGAVVVDANVLIAICANETDRSTKATAALSDYAQRGWQFYAPGVVTGEVLFVLCGKLQSGSLTSVEHAVAVRTFEAQMKSILQPPGGEVALIVRAEDLRSGYGCSRSADSIYLALAEELAASMGADLLTFDRDLEKQAPKKTPIVNINLLQA